MGNNDGGGGDGGSGGKRVAQASSRKGCMRGKGGPENASCTYKGVRQRTWGKWVSEIREPNRGSRVWLGTYDSARDAAIAYDAAARKLYGPNARLNLPDEVTTAPKPSRPAAQQRAAAVAAAAAEARYHRAVQQMKMKQEFEKQMHTYMQQQCKQQKEVKSERVDDDGDTNNQNVAAYDNMMNLSLGNYRYRSCEDDEKVGENEVGPQVFTRNLIANLPEFDDSGMWAEAVSTMDYQSQAIRDPGIAAPAYDAIGIELNHPLML